MIVIGKLDASRGSTPRLPFILFIPITEYRAANPLNPSNAVDPDNAFNPIKRVDPGNPANPPNRYNPNNPFNPTNNVHPDNPLNPADRYNPTALFKPLDHPPRPPLGEPLRSLLPRTSRDLLLPRLMSAEIAV